MEIKKAYSVISKLIYYDKKIKNIRSNFKNGYLPLFKNEYLKKLLKNFSKRHSRSNPKGFRKGNLRLFKRFKFQKL